MTKEKLDLNLLEAKEGKLEITHVNQVLETPKVYYDQSVSLSGTITAPGNFVEKRTKGEHMTEDQHERTRANVQYSYQNGYIKLSLEENKEVKYSIDGKLIVNPDISEMSINNGKRYSVPDLAQHLRMKRFFFASADEHKRLMEHLQAFRVKANKEIEINNDNRGNMKDLFEIKNESNLDLSFDVMIACFVGEPKKRFKVEIMYTVRERSVDVWLESPDLVEATKADAETIIDNELARMPDEYVFIEQ